jgi:hypothetical protein
MGRSFPFVFGVTTHYYLTSGKLIALYSQENHTINKIPNVLPSYKYVNLVLVGHKNYKGRVVKYGVTAVLKTVGCQKPCRFESYLFRRKKGVTV